MIAIDTRSFVAYLSGDSQSCLDHDVPLVTRDADFGSIARVAGLRLLL